jgi:hypothetical protein
MSEQRGGPEHFSEYYRRIEKEWCELRNVAANLKEENKNLKNELLRVKSEKSGINYFGSYDHIVLKEENEKLKAELDAVKQRVRLENVYRWQRDDLLKLSKQQDAEIKQLSKDRHDTERELIRTKANLAGEIEVLNYQLYKLRSAK